MYRRSKTSILILGIIVVLASSLYGQATNSETIPFIVSGKKGNPIETIERGHFRVSVNGREAKLSEISEVRPAKDIVFVVDLSLTDQKSIDEIKSTLLSLIQNLANGDRMQLLGFDSVLGRPTPMTSNRIILENHVRRLNFGFRRGSHFRDAVFEALVNEKNQEGRLRAVVLLSGGIDTGSKISESQLRTALNEAKAVQYVIQYFEPGIRNSVPQGPGQRPSTAGFGTSVRKSIKYLQSITDSSGGSYVFNRSNYRRIIGGIMKDISGFRLATIKSEFDKDVNEIKITSKSKKTNIRYRKVVLKQK